MFREKKIFNLHFYFSHHVKQFWWTSIEEDFEDKDFSILFLNKKKILSKHYQVFIRRVVGV
jgi:hypothetical protein